jgi:hypothetical protein
VGRRPAARSAGIGDKINAFDDCWDYHRIFSEVWCALGYDTTLLDGWFEVFWRNVTPLRCWGTTRPVTQCHISENMVPKVHGTLAGRRGALLSSVSSPDYLASTISRFDTHQSWQCTQFSSSMEGCLITASLFLMHQMECSLCIGPGGETRLFVLQDHSLLTP